MDELTQAVVRAAEHGAPKRVWDVGADAVVNLGPHHGHPFDGLTVTHWTVD
jgi:hypothetical protein